jgi:hypothetical protein
MTQDKLIEVWLKAARAKASQVKGESNLFAALARFATDSSLDETAFTERTKSLEESMMRDAPDEALKKAVRSSSSSARSVIASALDQGRSVIRDGKPVGKSRLEAEKKAVVAGHPSEGVMNADTDALKSMSASPTSDSVIDQAMSMADALKLMCESADAELLADIAHEILGADAGLTAAIQAQLDAA